MYYIQHLDTNLIMFSHYQLEEKSPLPQQKPLWQCYIGSGIDYIYSLEGSLKLKEVSYLHSFSINSGELKHGSLALVDSNTYCIAILSQANLYNSITSSLSEVRSRGGKTLLISNVAKASDLYVEGDSLALIVIMQLISYCTALKLNRSIDQPRNLAKSVTVK